LVLLMFQKILFTKKETSDSMAKSDFGCISGDTEGSLGNTAIIGCDSRELHSYIDSSLKSKLSPFQDDVYNLKKQVMSIRCNSQSSSNNKPIAITNARVNFAADELGARINHVFAKPIAGSNFIKNILGLEFNVNPPINMLRSRLVPGSCFGFLGSSATVSIRLAKVIVVEEISLTHVPKEMTPLLSVDNAPKDFEVYVRFSNSHPLSCLYYQ